MEKMILVNANVLTDKFDENIFLYCESVKRFITLKNHRDIALEYNDLIIKALDELEFIKQITGGVYDHLKSYHFHSAAKLYCDHYAEILQDDEDDGPFEDDVTVSNSVGYVPEAPEEVKQKDEDFFHELKKLAHPKLNHCRGNVYVGSKKSFR